VFESGRQHHGRSGSRCYSQIAGYDLVEAVQAACDKWRLLLRRRRRPTAATRLHAFTSDTLGQVRAGSQRSRYSCRHSCQSTFTKEHQNRIVLALALFSHQILFCSAETKCSAQAVKICNAFAADTAVVGACLPGHDYKGTATVAELNGCTSPWNTLALWDLRKLT
jgi:hypothetical protein